MAESHARFKGLCGLAPTAHLPSPSGTLFVLDQLHRAASLLEAIHRGPKSPEYGGPRRSLKHSQSPVDASIPVAEFRAF